MAGEFACEIVTARLKPEAVRVWGEQAYAQPDSASRLGTIYDQFLGFVELPRIFGGGQLIINAPTALREALDQIRGKVGLIRHIAAFRPRKIDNTTASAKAAMRALADAVGCGCMRRSYHMTRNWSGLSLNVLRSCICQALRSLFNPSVQRKNTSVPTEQRWSYFLDQFAANLRWIRV